MLLYHGTLLTEHTIMVFLTCNILINIIYEFSDVGSYVDCTMTKADVIQKVKSFDAPTRYSLLKRHHVPTIFTKTMQDGCMRSFKTDYFKDRSWLVYSERLDGAFCIPCLLFADSNNRQQLGSLVNEPFKRWTRVTKVVGEHADKEYHKESIVKSKAFINSVEKPEESNIAVMLDARRKQNIIKNREILSYIIETVLFLGRQGIAFRGHREDIHSCSGNNGNFLELIKLISKYDPVLAQHISSRKKTTYLSPEIQNQLIHIIGCDYIRPKIISEVQQARFFGILCDEATSAKKEYMSLVLRFVDANQEIREEFLGFIPVVRTSGQMLAEKILSTLELFGLDVEKCRGQGYDGAAAMSSDRCGVQAVIKERNDKALYFHCASHCLNLVITHSCKDVQVKTMIGKISQV